MADEKSIALSEGSPAATAAASTASDAATADSHKRKLEDLEVNNVSEPSIESEPDTNADALNNGTQEENVGVHESETKRPRLESNGDNIGEADGLDSQNGNQEEEYKDEPKEEESEQPESVDANVESVEDQEPLNEPLDVINQDKLGHQNLEIEEPSELPREGDVPVRSDEIQPGSDRQILSREMEVPNDMANTEISSSDKLGQPNVEIEEPSELPREGDVPVCSDEIQPGSDRQILSREMEVLNDEANTEISSLDKLGQPNVEIEEPSELPREEDVPVRSDEIQPGLDRQILSREMEVPNDKVGVLIGKSGDTIRSLQDNSGAKIQITRDADADPRSSTRPLELVGTLEEINKAEKLIKDVIAEADAGGSPSLVARGFNTAQAATGGDQVEIQVPIEKVGLIIGKGGETIRNLQTRSGARIQLIQQNLSDGEQPKERTVRITGNKKQIETAREMIKDVMNQTVRSSPLSSGYSQQQGYRPRGPAAPQWGPPRGPHRAHFSGYDYPQRGHYPSQNSQYPPPSYSNYPPQQAPRSNFGPGWEQRPPASPHGPSPQGNYNYGQHPGPGYGHPPPSYSQTPAQPYSHGYEPKYDNYQNFGPQPTAPTPYTQGGTNSYGPPQDQYAKPPMYRMPPSQVPHSQPYGQPRPNQPVEAPYQGPSSSAQSYGQNMPSQQSYPNPYASSGPIQQTYPNLPYGSVPTSDGYAHPPAAASSAASGYGQPVAGYGQAGPQQPPPAYPQAGAAGGYCSYPASQPTGYGEQSAAGNNAAYGYNQGPADPASYGAPQGPAAAAAYPATAGGQTVGYAQPTQTQPGYDQLGGYGNLPAPVGYGKSASPQPGYAPPQYDGSQMYGAHR